MRDRVVVTAVMAGLVGTALAGSLSMTARPKQYQWTGTVTAIDAEGKAMSVEKEGDVWEFSLQGLPDVRAKKGDKVTVHYVTIAKKVEAK
jgi:hypothetical protein